MKIKLSNKKINKKRNIKKTYKKQYGGRHLVLAQRPSGHYMYYKDTENSNIFHGFKPLQLNAAMVQYLCDIKSLQVYNLSDDESLYLGFKNFPSIVETIEDKKKLSKSVKDEYGQRDFTEVIEGNRPLLEREINYNNLMTSSQFKIELEKIMYPSINNSEKLLLENLDKKEAIISQDVEYVKKLILDLPRILEHDKSPKKSNDEICDLSYSTDNFLIVDRKRDYPGIDGEVVIVGYPGEINPFLKLKVPNPINPREDILLIDLLKKTIFEEHKKSETEPNNYCKLLIQLFNQFKSDTNKINPDNVDEYYKFIKPSLNSNLKYVKTILMNNPDIFPNGEKDYTSLEIKVDELLEELIFGIFTRPNTKIRYVFHPFLITSNGRIEPLLYNVRELESKHKPVLKRILELIQTEIPKRFEIFNDKEISRIRNGENIKFTNFYSYYRYGDIFHIKTEYLYPSTNMDQYSHVYNRSINLEELIYSSELVTSGNPFWSKLNFQYEIRNYRFNEKKTGLNGGMSKFTKKSNRHHSVVKTIETKVYLEKKKFLHIDDERLNISQILILRENPNSSYEIYCRSKNNKYYYLIIKPILNNRNIFLPGLCTPRTPHQIVFDCFNNVVNIYSINVPIFKIDTVIEITSSLALDKKYDKINLASEKYWYFPLLRRVINSSGLDKLMPFLQIINNYIPYTPFNVLNAKTYVKDTPIDINGKITEKNKSKNCALDICEYYEYNDKIEFRLDDKSYILMINKHTSDNNLIRTVVWLFNSSDHLEQLSPNRFKTIKNLNNPILIEEIIKQLIINGIYNPRTMFFGFNNFLTIDMESLHFQIFPKTEKTYYDSFMQANSYISMEKRMENFINTYYKIKLVNDYYKNYNFVVFTPFKLNNL